jgi:hypothetical protein
LERTPTTTKIPINSALQGGERTTSFSRALALREFVHLLINPIALSPAFEKEENH